MPSFVQSENYFLCVGDDVLGTHAPQPWQIRTKAQRRYYPFPPFHTVVCWGWSDAVKLEIFFETLQ
jgi:hypothetical protein